MVPGWLLSYQALILTPVHRLGRGGWCEWDEFPHFAWQHSEDIMDMTGKIRQVDYKIAGASVLRCFDGSAATYHQVPCQPQAAELGFSSALVGLSKADELPHPLGRWGGGWEGARTWGGRLGKHGAAKEPGLSVEQEVPEFCRLKHANLGGS